MQVILRKKPKNPIIVEGFPGLGFVGTIAVEFLIEHLNAELIGKISTQKLLPMAAIHKELVVEPLGIYYSKKYNLILIHALGNISGLEWEIAAAVSELAKQVKAKEIISLEGVSSQNQSEDALRSYYYSPNKNKKIEKLGMEPLKEGIVVGVSGALLLKDKLPLSCLFSETRTGLPDSRAAANIIKSLDKYLNLKIDYQPLLKKADEFEAKLKGMMAQAKEVAKLKEQKGQPTPLDDKEPDYFG
ncbi:MAG TPA: PAC2 family protein [Candidatus Nanoarchaeia archaeon]|nr:PAC2 family protein [Candidatus Nanoarchaeia archaeon]